MAGWLVVSLLLVFFAWIFLFVYLFVFNLEEFHYFFPDMKLHVSISCIRP